MGENAKIQALILDLGGVLIDIDWQKSYLCFQQIANNKHIEWEEFYEQVRRFERSQITAEQFRNNIREILQTNASDQEINRCFTVMIFDFPHHRKQLVKQLRNKYPVYLLSNINQIHLEYVQSQDYWDESLFDKIFWSCDLGYRKPEPEIYLKVLEQIDVQPEKVLFFDDTPVNVEAAQALGINAVLVDRDISDIIAEQKILA
jgi:putative hydrolase of the HAD superfamily